MLQLPSDIAHLIEAEKRLVIRPNWDSKTDSKRLMLAAPLTIGEVTTGGFEIRARVSAQFVDRDAMVQLQYAVTGRLQIPLWRCQWRPFETHTNAGWGPAGFAFREFKGTSHEHRFSDNFLPHEYRMRSGLPGAVPIDPDPATLSEFLAFCGQRFRIKDIDRIEIPEVGPDLFWQPND